MYLLGNPGAEYKGKKFVIIDKIFQGARCMVQGARSRMLMPK